MSIQFHREATLEAINAARKRISTVSKSQTMRFDPVTEEEAPHLFEDDMEWWNDENDKESDRDLNEYFRKEDK